ncbi:homocysteine S-methyltransferase family protein [Candidatus Latescibacterota bacterium]
MTLVELIQKHTIVITDGAWGTEIAERGFDPSFCPELFNITEPDMIRDIAASYVDAGSDIILTNTFGGSPQKLARYGLEERVEQLNEAGVLLSVEAAAERALVTASVGPTGDFLAPLGATSKSEMIATFSRQVRAFVKAGADAVIVETMSDLGEAICAVRAVKDNSDLEVVCSMTFDSGVRGYATMMGVTPEQAAGELEAAGADVVGSNCGTGIENMVEIAKLLRPVTDIPLWIKPNAGIPELVEGDTVFPDTPDEMAAHIPGLVQAGVTFIGGCCGTTPGHIRRFRAVIDSLLKKTSE